MPKYWNQKAILHKIETSEGIDAAPVGGTDGLLVYDFEENFLEGEKKTKPYDLPYMGARPSSLARLQRGATFKVPFQGAGGAATVVPAWMKLNRPAGMDAGVVNGTTSVIQKPITSGVPSATQYYGVQTDTPGTYEVAKVLGARAGLVVNFEDDEDPYLQYTYLGRPPAALATDEAVAATGAAAALFKDAVPFSTENSTVLLDGYAPPVRRLTLRSNPALGFRSLVGPQDRVLLRDRPWSGEILIEAPNISAKNYYASALSRAQVVLAVTHGIGTGNIVKVDAPKLQFGLPSRGPEDDVLMLTLPFDLVPTSAGNDEIVLSSS